VVDILLDMYRAPRFAERDIRQERGVIVEEIMMYQDQPQHIAQETLGMLLWRGHPLGRPLAGSPGNVMQMARDDILQFKQRNYVPCNTLISFAGYLDHEHCVHLVHERLGGISAGRRSSFRKVSGKTKQEQMAVVRKNIEQAHLALGFRIFGRRDPRRYAMKLLSVILGENMSSRLFQEVREKHGMAYSIHSSVHLFGDTGVFSISAGLDRRRALKAWRLIVRALKRFKEKPVSKAELRRAKDYAGGQLAIGLESTTSQMIWMGEYLMGYGRFMQPADAVRQLEQVSVEDLQTAARELIRLDNLSMAWVIPEDMEDIEPDVLAAAETL
jgi:predicted Zn-dependent peptidase